MGEWGHRQRKMDEEKECVEKHSNDSTNGIQFSITYKRIVNVLRQRTQKLSGIMEYRLGIEVWGF